LRPTAASYSSSSSFRCRLRAAHLGRGPQAAGSDDGGQAIVEGAPVSTGREAGVTEAGDYRLFAGWRSDPFFIDRRGMFFNMG